MRSAAGGVEAPDEYCGPAATAGCERWFPDGVPSAGLAHHLLVAARLRLALALVGHDRVLGVDLVEEVLDLLHFLPDREGLSQRRDDSGILLD